MPRFVPCPLCGCTIFRKRKEDCGADVVQCSDCSFLYVNPQPTSEELAKLYSEDYYGERGESVEDSLRYRFPVFRRGVRIIAELSKPGRVLDIGCGAGGFLELAKREGWEAFGVDPSDIAVNFARGKGLNVICGTLQTAGYAPGSFDVVTMWDVLEHLADPRRAIEEAHAVLKIGGFLVVRVPNTDFQLLKALMLERVFRGQPISLQGNLHLNHFSPASLRRLLTSSGFEVRRVEMGVSEDKVHKSRTPLWIKKAFCWMTEVLRKTTSIQLGPTMVQCARKLPNDHKPTPR